MSKNKKIIPGIWLFFGLALALIALILLVGNYTSPYFWILLVVSLMMIVLTRINHPDPPELPTNPTKERNTMYKIFFFGICGIIVILIFVGLWGVYTLQLQNTAFHSIAMAVIILWACVFLGYFMWGVYFYNINLGITEEEWDRIEAHKAKKARGEEFSQDELDEEPKYNPYADQTFGLPPGTVRGMIAFTLLFGSISMLIMSIGSKDCTECSTVIHDQYEFFKTAFLMMIAFYFGSRALETFQDKKNKNDAGTQDTQQSTKSPDPDMPLRTSGVSPDSIATIDPMRPATVSTPPSAPPTPPVIEQESFVAINPMK